jgi:putative membrane protein
MKSLVVFGFAMALAGSVWAQDKSASSASKRSGASADATFVMNAAKGGMAEVELGKLAAEKGSSVDVRNFGQRMVDDHSKAGDELKAIAQRKNIAWPTGIDAKEKALHDRLSKLSGDAFDQAYMQAMLDGHRKVANEVRTESRTGSDPDVKAWATQTLPTVEEHLRQAEVITKPVGTSGKKN